MSILVTEVNSTETLYYMYYFAKSVLLLKDDTNYFHDNL